MARKSISLLVGAALLRSAALPAQQDSLLLREVTVDGYIIKANRTFKEQTLSSDSLRNFTALSLGDALQQATGIFVKGYGSGGIATLSLRGTSAQHTRLYWNNLDVSSPTLGLADMSTVPLAAFDQIQVQYGFASLSDGSGGLGGSIRLQQKSPWQDSNSLAFRQMAGSFGRWQSALQAQWGSGRWRGQTGLQYREDRNNFPFPDITLPEQPVKRMRHANLDQSGLFQNLYFRENNRRLWSLKARWYRTRRKLPPPITGNPDTYDRLWDEGVNAILQVSEQRERSHWLFNTGLVSARNTFSAGADSSSSNNYFSSWQSNLRGQGNWSAKWHWEAALHYRLEQAGSPAFSERVSRTQAQFMGQLTRYWGARWQMSLLLRQEHIGNQFSPLLGSWGLLFSPRTTEQFRLNIARNYRFPTLNDQHWTPGGNPYLLPEQSWSTELGYRHSYTRQEKQILAWELSLYYNDVDNWIQWAPLASLWQPQNLKQVSNYGLEWSGHGHWQLGKWHWGYQWDYRYTISTVKKVYGGKEAQVGQQLPYVPPHRLVLGVHVRRGAWELRYGQQLSSRYFTNGSNTVYMPLIALGEWSLRHRSLLGKNAPQIEGAITVHNLWDYDYQRLPFRPEPGLHLSVQLQWHIQLK